MAEFAIPINIASSAYLIEKKIQDGFYRAPVLRQINEDVSKIEEMAIFILLVLFIVLVVITIINFYRYLWVPLYDKNLSIQALKANISLIGDKINDIYTEIQQIIYDLFGGE